MNKLEGLICEELSGLVIEGARIIDPYSGRDEIGDVCVTDGRVSESAPKDARRIMGQNLIVCPGLADLHVHLREPGQTHKETIETGTAAAAAGGFTYVACMPNTRPPLDEPDQIRDVLDRAGKVGHCRVGPTGTITRGRGGKDLTDFGALREAGAVAFTDDGDGVERDDVMRRAFVMAAKLDVVLIQHCEYRDISAGGVMHAGEVAERLGLPGLDPKSEEAMIERDLDLCRETGGRYHVAHISTARAVELVRCAKAEGLPVTAEVCTHHLILTDEACSHRDPNTKMHPPLRPQRDVEACREGLIDQTIDCIVTDHAPHTLGEKDSGFLKAPPGIVGLETALALAARAMLDGEVTGWDQIVGWFTTGPSKVLNLEKRPITVGQSADLTIIDTLAEWTVDPECLLSMSKNTPFGGWNLKGRPLVTVNAQMVRHPASLGDWSEFTV